MLSVGQSRTVGEAVFPVSSKSYNASSLLPPICVVCRRALDVAITQARAGGIIGDEMGLGKTVQV